MAGRKRKRCLELPPAATSWNRVEIRKRGGRYFTSCTVGQVSRNEARRIAAGWLDSGRAAQVRIIRTETFNAD